MQAFNPNVVFAVERGGPFIADAITYGDAQLTSRIARVPKPTKDFGWGKTTEKMIDDMEAMIKSDPAREWRFAFTDVYFSGGSYNTFQGMIERIARKYPNCRFQGFWMREQVGFEIAAGDAGPVLRVPKDPGLRNVTNSSAPVPFVIGDDADRILQALESGAPDLEAIASEPIYIFDSSGAVQRVIQPKPGEKTRDLVLRILNGGT